MIGARLVADFFGEPSGQGWAQVIELLLALVLSSLIGLEREVRRKSAGLRTHALVGLGAAMFVLLSQYGFTDVLHRGTVVLDPSRVAAQIVTGVGFLGGGLIFVRRDAVQGLTTAAVVWVTAAVGAACGAGLLLLAIEATAGFFVVVLAYPLLSHRLPRSAAAASTVRVRYADGRGLLRSILAEITHAGFAIGELVASQRAGDELGAELRRGAGGGLARGPRDPEEARGRFDGQVEVTLQVHGTGSVNVLAAQLAEMDGVIAVSAGDVNDATE